MWPLIRLQHFSPARPSSFFCLDTKESKNQGLQNTPASILSNCKCGRVICSTVLRSFPSLLAIRFVFPCPVLMAGYQTPNIISSENGIRFSRTKKILTISDQDFKENQLYFFINLQFQWIEFYLRERLRR
jgi:hypothetical protein